MAAILVEPPAIDSSRGASMDSIAPDPVVLTRTTTSLGSYCLRWELVLKGRMRSLPTGRPRNVAVGSADRGID